MPRCCAAIGEWPRSAARAARRERGQGRRRRRRRGRPAARRAGAAPDALIVVDADGQHPPDRIPEFVDGGRRVRRRDRRSPRRPRLDAVDAPLHERGLERAADARHADGGCSTRSAGCGSTGSRRSSALRCPPGRYEAETRHLRAALRAGLRSRLGADPRDLRRRAERVPAGPRHVARARLDPRADPRAARRVLGPRAEFARRWAVRFALLVAGTLALRRADAAARSRSTSALFLEVNSLGAGPEWLHDALDPHTRNYILLCLAATVGAAFSRTPGRDRRRARDDDRRALVGRARPARLHAVRARPAGGGAGRAGAAGRGRPLGAHRVVPQRPHGRHDGDRRRRDRGGPVAARAVLDLLRADRADPDHVRRALPARRRRGDGVRLPGRPVRMGAGLPLRPHRAPARTNAERPRSTRRRGRGPGSPGRPRRRCPRSRASTRANSSSDSTGVPSNGSSRCSSSHEWQPTYSSFTLTVTGRGMRYVRSRITWSGWRGFQRSRSRMYSSFQT